MRIAVLLLRGCSPSVESIAAMVLHIDSVQAARYFANPRRLDTWHRRRRSRKWNTSRQLTANTPICTEAKDNAIHTCFAPRPTLKIPAARLYHQARKNQAAHTWPSDPGQDAGQLPIPSCSENNCDWPVDTHPEPRTLKRALLAWSARRLPLGKAESLMKDATFRSPSTCDPDHASQDTNSQSDHC
jgi:hypothetical protein